MQQLSTPTPSISKASQLIYKECGWEYKNITEDKESAAYNGCRFILNGKSVLYRDAKITPSKPGLFVTIWKRNQSGITTPFVPSDGIDLVVIGVSKELLSGLFVFPARALVAHGIMSSADIEGKRGFRVYPPWEHDLNKQATKTQQWQVKYFLQTHKQTSHERAKMLFGE